MDPFIKYVYVITHIDERGLPIYAGVADSEESAWDKCYSIYPAMCIDGQTGYRYTDDSLTMRIKISKEKFR